jgi:hypothetical protein
LFSESEKNQKIKKIKKLEGSPLTKILKTVKFASIKRQTMCGKVWLKGSQ